MKRVRGGDLGGGRRPRAGPDRPGRPRRDRCIPRRRRQAVAELEPRVGCAHGRRRGCVAGEVLRRRARRGRDLRPPITAKGTGDILGAIESGSSRTRGGRSSICSRWRSEGVTGTASPSWRSARRASPATTASSSASRSRAGRSRRCSRRSTCRRRRRPTARSPPRGRCSSYLGVAGGRYTLGGAKPLIFHSRPGWSAAVRGADPCHRARGYPGPVGVAALPPARARGLLPRRDAPRHRARLVRRRIPADAVTPDGIDYFLDVAGAVFDPRMAARHGGAHTMGVAVPEVASAAALLAADQGAPSGAPLPATGARRPAWRPSRCC